MRQLLQTLAAPLAEGVSPGGPFVYVTAIHSTAGLTRSLAGITLISREMGFERDAETLYSGDAQSATFHALHRDKSTSLAVEVCPPRQTVSIAVAGDDDSTTYQLFLEADHRLFGRC